MKAGGLISLRSRFLGATVVAVLLIVGTGGVNVGMNASRAQAQREARQLSSARAGIGQLLIVLIRDQAAVEEPDAPGVQGGQGTAPGFVGEDRILASLTAALAGRGRELADLEAVARAAQDWRTVARSQLSAASGGPLASTDPLLVRQRQLFQALVTQLQALESQVTQTLTSARQRLDRATARLTTTLYASLLLAAALLALLLLLMNRWVLDPLAKITSAVRTSRAPDALIPAVGPPEIARLGADVEAMRARAVRQTAVAVAANEALQLAEAQVRGLFDNVRNYAIMRLDPEGVFTTWNAGAEVLTGFPASAVVGRHATMFLHPDVPLDQQSMAVFEKAQRHGYVTTRRWSCRADGGSFLADATITPILEDGMLAGFAVIARDVTAVDAAERALAAANAELAGRADQLQATNQRTEQANLELAAINRELEAFSYTVSHDLRAPLRAIRGFSAMLVEEDRAHLSERGLHYLDTIARNATRMNQLIDDLLAFARLRHASLIKGPTELDQVLRSAWEELAPLRASVEVTLDVDPLPTVLADPRLVRQVFVNLLANAVKFSARRSGAHIGVECQPSADASGPPVITVRDNGTGFDPAHADRLFGVFQRLHSETEFEGTGIGLSIVERIVHRHGGTVWATSELGQGAAFSFTLGPDTASPSPVPS